MPKAPEPSSTCQKTTKSLPRISPKSYCYNAVPNRFLAHFSTSRTNGPRLLSRAKAGTHSAFARQDRTQRLTRRNRGVSDGGGITTLGAFRTFQQTLRGQGVERQTLPLLGLGRRHSRRTQRACGTAMRLCASLSRGVAAPLGCVIFFRFCRNCGLFALCAQGLSACARHGRYHYPRRALRAAETLGRPLVKSG